MTVNASGPVSLAGATTGQSIAVELGQSATAQISLNDSNVRTLAGVASGAITMPTNFWGKSNAPTVIGQAFGGGYYVGQISTTANGTATHYLVAAPRSTGQNDNIAIKSSNSATSGTSSTFNGAANTSSMGNITVAAASFCTGLSLGGYTDWYLAAIDELQVLYYNLKPITYNNSTTDGINYYAVPQVTSNYTTSNPDKTTVSDFQWPNGANYLSSGSTWSSTDTNGVGGDNNAYILRMINGNVDRTNKQAGADIRAIRRVAVGVATPGAIGDPFQGGYYAGAISVNADNVATHYLVISPRSGGSDSTNKAYRSTSGTISGAVSRIEGPSNTSALIASAYSSPAANFVRGLSIGGYTDWYIPALHELTIFYYNLKPTTGANDTFSGANPYAVPARGSNYTSGNPARTSNTDYQSNGSGTGGTQAMQMQSNFNAWFWTSTEYASNTNRNYRVFPGGGEEDVTDKTSQQVVRAFRKIPV